MKQSQLPGKYTVRLPVIRRLLTSILTISCTVWYRVPFNCRVDRRGSDEIWTRELSHGKRVVSPLRHRAPFSQTNTQYSKCFTFQYYPRQIYMTSFWNNTTYLESIESGSKLYTQILTEWKVGIHVNIPFTKVLRRWPYQDSNPLPIYSCWTQRPKHKGRDTDQRDRIFWKVSVGIWIFVHLGSL